MTSGIGLMFYVLTFANQFASEHATNTPRPPTAIVRMCKGGEVVSTKIGFSCRFKNEDRI